MKKSMERSLKLKCSGCGHWNCISINIPINKIFIEQSTPEPKVKAYVPMYEPLEVLKCMKCEKSTS